MSGVVDLIRDSPIASTDLTKFIHEVFPIKYPEDWISEILGCQNDGNFCYGAVEEGELRSILLARVLRSDDEEITIPDLHERMRQRRICYLRAGSKNETNKKNFSPSF